MTLFRLVRRDFAEQYLLMVLISFAASVSLTRLFLSLTGYPQIGGGDLHIAHALWGGLLLFIATLLTLMVANRWVYSISALLAGTGVGLFIDEVGKFITQHNDYFYPAAAPIIYVFFLLTILLVLNIQRFTHKVPNADLHQVIDQIQDLVIGPAKHQEHALLKERLELIIGNCASKRHADLAQALLIFVQEESLPVLPSTPPPPDRRIGHRTREQILRLLTDEFLHLSLALGVIIIGFLTLKNPIQVLFAPWLPPAFDVFLQSLYSGHHIDPTASPLWFSIRMVLEVIVGAMLLTSAGFLMTKRTKQGIWLAHIALLLSLTTVNLLLFYFEQFSTIMTTLIQFTLLLEVIYYRRRLIKQS